MFTPGDLVRAIYRKLVGSPAGNSTNEMFDSIVEKLMDSGRIIIVDEAEYLPVNALETVRRIYDKAHIGVLLCGMERLRANIVGRANDFLQLYSRIYMAVKISGLQPEDTEAIVAEVLPDNAELWPVFHAESKRICRHLANLLENAIRLAKVNDCAITSQLVRDTAKTLII